MKKFFVSIVAFIASTSIVAANNSSLGGGGFSGGSSFGGGASSLGGGGFTGATAGGSDSSGGSNSSDSSVAGAQAAVGVLPTISIGGDSIKGSDIDKYTPSGAVGLSGGRVSSPGSSWGIGDFQRNVQVRTGLVLGDYGYSVFNMPNTFAPVDSVPVDDNYVLGPGDEVILQSSGAVEINYTAQISKDGTIFLPKVGSIDLAGVKASNLDNYLTSKIGKVYRNFTLTSTISKIKSIQVNVAGFANRPGTYTLSSLSTLTNAVFAVGGPSYVGSLRHVQVKRGGDIVVDYDMYDILLNGDDSKDVRLLPGDIIYFAPKGMQVAIYDGVKVPAIYEARKGESVKDIVRFAGGYTYNNSHDKIVVEHIDDHKAINVLDYDFTTGLQHPVSNGEIIHFFNMNNVYQNAVILIGNVANPTRLEWKEGMTIRDIIPTKETLLTRSFWDSYAYNTYGRDNMLTQIGIEKTAMLSASANITSFSSGLNSYSGQSNTMEVFSGGGNLFTAGPIRLPEADINWNYAVIVRLNKENYDTELIPFNLHEAIEGNLEQDKVLMPGDIINILSSKDVRNPSANSKLYVFIDGEVNNPGIFELQAGSTLNDLISTAGGITSSAYLYGLEIDREYVKKRQKAALDRMLDNMEQSLLAQANNPGTPGQMQLQDRVLSQQQAFIAKMRQLKPNGRIVLHLSSNNISESQLPKVVLENGDTIYIPPTPSSIDVIGQVYNPSTFIYDPRNTVGDYVDMAGTPNQFADTSSIYVLHADGTLYSKQQAGFFGAFYSKYLYAGDAIVVPQEIQFSSITQNLIDWTQILANFGLGAAAIKQLSN